MSGPAPKPWASRPVAASIAAGAGLLGLVVFFAFLVLPGSSGREAGPPAPREDSGWLDPTDYPPQRGRPAPPLVSVRPDPAAEVQARTSYARLCASCHGAEGRGDGLGARGMVPPPRAFTRPGGWKLGFSLAAIYRTLETGLPGTAMGSYRHLPRQDRLALARVVMALGAFDHGPEDLEALERQLQQPAEPSPNRIPVPLAMAILCREAPAPGRPLQGPAWAVLDPDQAGRTCRAHPGGLASEAAFLRMVAPQVQENGFAPAVLLLPPQRRRALLESLP